MDALNYLTKEVSEAVDSYMTTLSHVGYKSYCSVNKLLIYTFIEEMLSTFNSFITEDDYNSMFKVLNCLYGSCMIPFPYYIKDINESNKIII